MFTISCQSPADVEADRDVVRVYDPSLTNTRLRIDTQSDIAFGAYDPNKDTVYTFQCTNISGSEYRIREIQVTTEGINAEYNAIYPVIPEDINLSSGGEGAKLKVPIRTLDMTQVIKDENNATVLLTVIGETDTVQFRYRYSMPDIVVKYSQFARTSVNANTSVNINFRSFLNRQVNLQSISVIPDDGQLYLPGIEQLPMTIPANGTGSFFMILNPKQSGVFNYQVSPQWIGATNSVPKELLFDSIIVR
ncbi:MAG: hypothetical protein Kapaf2KO_02300 [Candidatus Kapaibacteriales bacterium]